MAARNHFVIKRGLDLPISGVPSSEIDTPPQPERVALVAADAVGLRPTMLAREGDAVKRGQPLYEDKKNPGVRFTAPGAGTVVAVNRGERRALQSVVIALNANERGGELTADDQVAFESYTGEDVNGLDADAVRALLLESGLWTALRTRPFSKIPPVDGVPHALFITATDTNPLAPAPEVALRGREADFEIGVRAVAKLTEGKSYLCRRPGSGVPGDASWGVEIAEFEGVHPAGTVGVHIHMLAPAHRERVVWHLHYQDVASIGRLFRTGTLDVERLVSLGGPAVKNPRLLRTRVGASIDELTKGELQEGDLRVISGSVLSGRIASGDALGYLGRFHLQITALREGREREFLGWMAPGFNKFSLTRVFASALSRGKRYDFTTNLNGSERAMVPIGLYEKVMPMDLMPTHLLRAIAVGDVEKAEELGCLELDEEDLALCTFVCPGKIEYGPLLRANLEQIEKEG